MKLDGYEKYLMMRIDEEDAQRDEAELRYSRSIGSECIDEAAWDAMWNHEGRSDAFREALARYRLLHKA